MNFTPTLGIQAMNLLAAHLGFAVPTAPICLKNTALDIHYRYNFDLPLNQRVSIDFHKDGYQRYESCWMELTKTIRSLGGDTKKLAVGIKTDDSSERFPHFLRKDFGGDQLSSYYRWKKLSPRLLDSLQELSVSCNTDNLSATATVEPCLERKVPVNVSFFRNAGFYEVTLADLTASQRFYYGQGPIRLFVPDPQHGFTAPFIDPVKTFEWGAGLYLTVQTPNGVQKFADFGLEAFRNIHP